MTSMNCDSRDPREWESFAKKIAAPYVAAGVDAEDLHQEAFLVLLEELPNYNPQAGVNLKNFVRRRLRDRFNSLYRKTLNLVQVEQHWVLAHKSGDTALAVKDASKERLQAVAQAHPGEYTTLRHVKVLVPIGPRLDDGWDEKLSDDDSDLSGHEMFGSAPEQEWMSRASERLSEVQVSKNEDVDMVAVIRMRREGYTSAQIGAALGKSAAAIRQSWCREQKRLAKRAA